MTDTRARIARRASHRDREVSKVYFRALGISFLLWASGVDSFAAPVPAATQAPPAEHASTSTPPATSSVSDEFVKEAPTDGRFVMLSVSDDANDWDRCGYDCGPLWTARFGAVILDLSKPEENVLAQPAGGLVTVSADGEFDFDWAGGVDVYFACQPAGSYGLEMCDFDLDSKAAFAYGHTGNLEIANASALNLFDVDSTYNSHLHSTDVNLRVPGTERVTGLAGLRWLELHEELNCDVESLGLINNDFNWDTGNHLYHGQMGTDPEPWDLASHLSINSALGAGVYGNNVDNQYSYHIANIPVLRGGNSDSDVTFVGDSGINLSYRVTRHLALTGVYQLLWISGAALASDQAALTLEELDLDVLTTSGNLFYRGAITGAAVTW